MWDVLARRTARETTPVVGVTVLEGRDASTANVPSAARSRDGTFSTNLIEIVDTDLLDDAWTGGGPKPGADLIQRWASQAHDAFVPTQNDQLVITAEGALEWQDAERRTLAVAWHDESIAVVPVSPDMLEVQLLYSPAPSDAARAAAMQARYGLPGTISLDWIGYFGTRSLKVEGDQFFRPVRRGLMSAAVRTAGLAGVLVGKVARVLGRDIQSYGEDPDRLSRLRAHLDRRRSPRPVAPDLVDLSEKSVVGDRCVIFVHGTMSCGIPNSDLLASVPGLSPLYRFEHDTFQEIIDNAKRLRELILSRIQTPKVLLLCHSRGGLVGRQTCQLMHNDGKQMLVWTYGTPHEGTPLANAAKRSLGMLYKLGTITAGPASIELPVSAAFRYMLRSGELPPGIETMTAPPSGVLKVMNASGDPYPIRSYGASHEGPGGPTGVKIAFKGAVGNQLFRGERNDLVVTVRSATSRPGQTQVLTPCTHSEYFSNTVVKEELADFFTRRSAGA
jgi:hypothetical protein